MAFARISQVAHYVPDNIVTNDDLSNIMDTSDEWIRSRTGIHSRHLSMGQQTSDLASEVAYQLLAKSGYRADELDFVLVATITPDSNMPSTAARVQANIGAVNAFAFDISAACSGFVFALATAEKFIQSGTSQKGLVIGAEVFSKALDWTDRRTAVLFGDGAGGVLVEQSETNHFLAEKLYTDGSKVGLESGMTRLHHPFYQGEEVNPYLQMDGRAIFDFTIKTVSQSVKDMIEKMGEPDFLLLHQANIRILDKMAKKIGVPREKFLANMQQYGNTSAASIPILLSESVNAGVISMKGRQKILFSGFGGGLTWGNILVLL